MAGGGGGGVAGGGGAVAGGGGRKSIARSHLLIPCHCPDMTEMLLKSTQKRKSYIENVL